jgi:hypothetical protein
MKKMLGKIHKLEEKSNYFEAMSLERDQESRKSGVSRRSEV